MGGRLRGIAAVAALATAGVLAPAAHGATVGWMPTLPVSQQSWQMLSAFPDGTAFAFDRGSSAMTLWHSANYGVAWDALTYLPAGSDTYLSVRFGSPEVGYAVDGMSLLRTTDGATTATSWKPLTKPSLPAHDWFFGHSLGVTGRTVAVGGERMHPLHRGCNPPGGEDIWTSHDSGRHWLTAELPRNTYVGSIDYLDARLGVAVAYDMHDDPADTLGDCTQEGDRTSLWVTHDGGRHFARAYRCGTAAEGNCWSAKFLTASTLIAGRNNGTTVISRDGGRTFKEGPELGPSFGSTGTYQDADFWVQGFDLANQVVYATTKAGGAFRSTDFGRSWTREPSCDSAYSLGVGEVAAFDADRAIAGGPSCVATRIAPPTAPVATDAPAPTSRVDIVQRAPGQMRTIDDGRLRISR